MIKRINILLDYRQSISDFFRKLIKSFKNYIFKSHVLTKQEQQFINIIQSLLKHPQTSLKLTSHNYKYYLSNPTKQCDVIIRDLGIHITAPNFICAKSLHPQVYNIILDLINGVLEDNKQQSEDLILKTETKILNKLINELKK
jgi:hypothetical protein